MTSVDLTAAIIALPETAGSALYGMVDVLGAAGNLWQDLSGASQRSTPIRPLIVSLSADLFHCGNGIPVLPQATLENCPPVDLVILPEMWLAPDDDLRGRYDDVIEWIRTCYRDGSSIYSACSGAILLARTGLLRGCQATSHWAYQDLFRKSFPDVDFQPDPSLVFAEPGGRIVTAGGTTSWHDLALHIISRYCGPGEALRIAKVYLLKWHGEGQLPYANLAQRHEHADAAVRRIEDAFTADFRSDDCIKAAIAAAGIPERTAKRRFKLATGKSMIDFVQGLRIEEAKRLLESADLPTDEIAAAVGYENAAFFRRIFKRSTGLSPAAYRRMFAPMLSKDFLVGAVNNS